MGMLKEKCCNKKVLSQKIVVLLLFVFVLLSTNAFNFIYWNVSYAGWVKNSIFYGLMFYLIMAKSKRENCHFYKEILFLIILPFLSIINSSIEYSQPINRSFTVLLSQFVWVIYFLLHRYKVQENSILKVLFYLSICIFLIQVVQQFTYPVAPFGTMSEDAMVEKGMSEAAEQRNGLWRFRVHQNAFYTAPLLFFIWCRLRQKFSAKMIVWIAILLASVYLTLTRQVMVACILAILLSMIMGKKKINLKLLFVSLLLFAGLYAYYDVLFSSLAEQTQNDVDDDNVRLLAASVLWGESIKSPLVFLFGYGLPDGTSAYAIHMFKLRTFFGIYTSDVGVVGQIFERGFLYVFLCYYVLYKVFFKLKNIIPLYIRMFVIFTGVMSVMIFPCMTPAQNIVWVMLLYVCDLHINKSPLALKIKK